MGLLSIAPLEAYYLSVHLLECYNNNSGNKFATLYRVFYNKNDILVLYLEPKVL